MEICVFGASSMTIDKKYTDAVEEMGEFLAKRGHNLVFGSGSTGSMGAAARGFKKGGGKTLLQAISDRVDPAGLEVWQSREKEQAAWEKQAEERPADRVVTIK